MTGRIRPLVYRRFGGAVVSTAINKFVYITINKKFDNRIRIAYSIWNITQARRSARAHTVLVTTDADGRLLWRTPPVLRDRLAPRPPACDRARDA